MNEIIESVCDGCSNWNICKFSEDVKQAEKQFVKMRENANFPECIDVEKMLKCKYKQYVTNRLTNDLIIKYSNLPFTDLPVISFDSNSNCNETE